jgi:hypothetical protein
MRVFLLSLAALLTSCHYHLGYDSQLLNYSTINIPYVEGDEDGELTAEVIRQFSLSGELTYVQEGGDLTLKMKILELRDENIGFRYDRKKRGNIKRVVIPTETRIEALVEVKVVESASGKVVKGPVRIKSSVDFDHDYYSSRHGINIFSLGQLTDIDAAEEAVQRPLNQRIGEKVVDYVVNSLTNSSS